MVAVIADRLAAEAGATPLVRRRTVLLALLRWAGCTANAREFSELLGDDVHGRAEFIAGRNPFVSAEPPDPATMFATLFPLVVAQCEAVGLMVLRLGLEDGLLRAAEDFFENWDGSGIPHGRKGDQIDEAAQYVTLASDVEVYNRNFGPARAAILVDGRAGKMYEPGLARLAVRRMQDWLKNAQEGDPFESALTLCGPFEDQIDLAGAVALLGDYADLKRPDQTGSSRLAQQLAGQMARLAGYDPEEELEIAYAAELSELGQVAVSNTAFASGWINRENRRLIPHWTERILSRMPALASAAKLAGMAHERLDGSGQSRGLPAPAQPFEARIVQVARFAVELRMESDRALQAWPIGRLQQALEVESQAQRLDPRACALALKGIGVRKSATIELPPVIGLTEREREILAGLIRGRSNKEIARDLGISPSTVGTHVERIYRKLGVSSRAAAAMTALQAGLLSV